MDHESAIKYHYHYYQHERTYFYSICYFGSLICFAHFMIMLGEELPSLPPLTARHGSFIIQIFEQLSCFVKQRCPETFHCVEIFFIFQEFWATGGLPWKNRVALNSLYWIYIFLIIQDFEQLAHALKNRVCPEIFHFIEIFLSFRIFEKLALALKTKFFMKFVAVLNILFTFRMFELLVLALKNKVCPEFTVLNVFFILQNFEQLGLAMKNRICPENFHCIEYSFYIQNFWATCACPEKQSLPWIHIIECIFYPSEFWTTWACHEKQNLPWKFSLHWI